MLECHLENDINDIRFSFLGLSSSNQKRCRAQAAQPPNQHYLTGQIVHHSPQYHRGVVDRWDRKGRSQSFLQCVWITDTLDA